MTSEEEDQMGEIAEAEALRTYIRAALMMLVHSEFSGPPYHAICAKLESALAAPSGEQDERQYHWTLERLHADDWPCVRVVEGPRFWGRIKVVSP